MNKELHAKDELIHGLAVSGFDYDEIKAMLGVSCYDIRFAIKRVEKAELDQ